MPLDGTVTAGRLDRDVCASCRRSCPRAQPTLSLGVALVFALVGGLLLNLMPCVFPVLSLKVLGFAAHAIAAERCARMGSRSPPA